MQRNTSTLCGACKQHPQEIGSVKVSLLCKRQLYVYFIYVSFCWFLNCPAIEDSRASLFSQNQLWFRCPLNFLRPGCPRDLNCGNSAAGGYSKEVSWWGGRGLLHFRGFMLHPTPLAGCRRCSEQRGSNHNTSKGRVGWLVETSTKYVTLCISMGSCHVVRVCRPPEAPPCHRLMLEIAKLQRLPQWWILGESCLLHMMK